MLPNMFSCKHKYCFITLYTVNLFLYRKLNSHLQTTKAAMKKKLSEISLLESAIMKKCIKPLTWTLKGMCDISYILVFTLLTLKK